MNVRNILLIILIMIYQSASAENKTASIPDYSGKEYQQLKGIHQLYLSPSGKDSGSCSEKSPCRSFPYAVSNMNPGDALILLPGYYSIKDSGGLSYSIPHIPDKKLTQLPSGLSQDKPTIIRAMKEGTVEVESGFTLGTKFKKEKYILVYGITFNGPSALRNADFSVVKRTGIYGHLSIGTIDHSEGCSYNLVEDVWIWGKNSRGNAVNYRAHHNMWRRVIIRDDGCDMANCGEGPGNYSIGMTIYNSHDVTAENVIVLDRILYHNPYGYADFATAQHDSKRKPQPGGELNGRNRWLGCMSINSVDHAINFEADKVLDYPNTTGTIEDFVALKTRFGLSIDGAHRPYEGYSHYVINNVEIYTTKDHNFYIGCDIVNPKHDAGCHHDIKNVSKGRYRPGHSYKLPKYRYGTKTKLWPWPNQKQIKSDMCKNDDNPRGLCLYDGSLTDYIMSF